MAVKSGLAGMATGERWARGESEQVKASCGAHAGVVGLGAFHQCVADLPNYASVPRDNFVPVAISSNTPCGRYRHESAQVGRLERRSEGPCQGP